MTDYSNNNVNNKSSSTLGGIFEYHSKMITDNYHNTLKCSSNENMKEYLLTRPVIEPNKDNDKVNSPLTCVMPDGSRYFLRMRSDDDHNNNINNNNNDNVSGFLLSKPMSELTKVADRMLVARHVRIQQELEKHASLNEQSKLKHIQGFNEDDDIDLLISNTQNDIKNEVDDKPNKKSEKGVLWVEKYSPNAFSQLLSSEKINRDVLKAVKGWDRFVFKDTDHNISKGSLPGPFTPAAKGKGTAQKNTNNSGAADEEPDDEMDIEENIKDLRPYQKVILLCGPPGTGKTTLAHCIAKHCGYRPFEINASDDRSKDVLVESITKSMQSTLDWEQKSKDNKSKSSISNTPSKEKLKEKTSGKPNCLILDEIDGIDSRNTIDAIINIVKAPLYVKDKNKSKKGKSNKATVLTRPMICICNDQFAPNLRELKKMALVYVFQPPSEVRLVQRLKAICSAERLQVTTSALTALCSATGNDIRSSLNTLQFASLHASKLSQDASSTSSSSMSTLGVASTLTSMISSGLKDENKDIYQIWREVFSSKEISSVLSQKRSRLLLDNSNAIDANEKPSGIQPSMEVFQSALSFGDMPLVMSGVHENMLKIRYSDPTMVRTFMCCNWLSISDNIDAFAYNWSDGYQTQVYIPVSLGAIHMLRATENRVNIEWPMKDRNVHYQRQQRLNIMSSLREGPEQGRGIIHSTTLSSNKIIALDVVSYLLDILRPRNVRAVSYGTLSVPEKNMLQDVVKVMASCGLSYISASHAETHNAFSYNQPSLALEPAISDLVKYAECENDLIKNRHTDLAMELCNHISLELKKYLIISRDICDEANSSSIPSKTPTKANIPLPSKDISMHQQRSIDDNAAKLIKGQEMDAAEIAMQKRILKGRMDFFCKAAPKKDNDVSKKENNSNKRSISELNSDMTTTTTTTTTTQVDQQYKKPVLFYKFNQGFSNAVRRPVSIEDFL